MIKSEILTNPVTTRVKTTTTDVYISQSPVRRHHHRHNVKSRYEFLKSLGKGTYGKVKLAKHRETNKLVAVKTIKKEKIRDVDMKHIRREMEIMSSIENQHIIQIYEVFENHDKIVIVMEYAAGGELYDYLALKRGICDQEAKSFFRQIVSAVRYCHKRGVVHRDLKLENILLNKDQQIKIADFGLANKFKAGSLLQTFCGSPLYASPEIVTGEPYIGPEVDSWSLGVLLYALVYGTMPFDGRDYSVLTKQITTGEFCQPPHFSEAHQLICWMLTVDPLKRATIDDIAHHPWVNIINDPVSLPPTNVDDVADYNTYLGVEIDLNENILEANKPKLVNQSPDIINNPVNENFSNHHHHPKSILKHKETPVVATPTPQKAPITPQLPKQPSADTILAGQLAAVCGLHAKDSLKLKVKPQGVSSKRRVLRSKRDRESGYYSSPERAPIPEMPPTVILATENVSENSNHIPRIKGAMITNQQRSANMRPVISSNAAALPPRVPHKNNNGKEFYLMPVAPQDRLTSVSSDDGSSVGSHTRPLSTYSDSSILSTDSFDLCSFENPLGMPEINTGCYPPQNHSGFINIPQQAMHPVQRPFSLPIAPDTLPSPNPSTLLDDQEPGSLTPNSEKLVRDLQRILAPNGRRSSPRTQKHDLTRRPHSLDEAGSSQLSSMMTQLNIDLDLAYKKALDICANLKVAEV